MRKRLLLLPAAGAALALLPVLSLAEDERPAKPNEKKPPAKIDLERAISKGGVERPVKEALKRSAPAPELSKKLRELPLSTGVGKSMVEGPVLRRLSRAPNGVVIVSPPGVYPHPLKGSPFAPGLQQQRKKERVERPVKRALKRSAPSPALRTGESKKKVEAPVKRALRRPAPRIASRRTPLPRPGERVQPGLVTWHTSYEAALAASKRSGKPVMLFHGIGRLDDRFC